MDDVAQGEPCDVGCWVLVLPQSHDVPGHVGERTFAVGLDLGGGVVVVGEERLDRALGRSVRKDTGVHATVALHALDALHFYRKERTIAQFSSKAQERRTGIPSGPPQYIARDDEEVPRCPWGGRFGFRDLESPGDLVEEDGRNGLLLAHRRRPGEVEPFPCRCRGHEEAVALERHVALGAKYLASARVAHTVGEQVAHPLVEREERSRRRGAGDVLLREPAHEHMVVLPTLCLPEAHHLDSVRPTRLDAEPRPGRNGDEGGYVLVGLALAFAEDVADGA